MDKSEENPTHIAPPPDTNQTTRMKELELMHHWCSKTCHSFSPAMSTIFQDYAVYLGTRHELLMDSLLALTCLHSVTERTGPDCHSSIKIDDAFPYQERALPIFRTELERISQSNCEVLLLCSMVMMAFAAVPPIFISEGDTIPGGDLKGSKSSLTSMFFFGKGIHSVIDSARPWLEKSPLKVAIRLYPREYWTSPMPDTGSLPPELNDMCDNVSELLRGIYSRAIVMLENCTAVDERMTLAWAIEVGDAFVTQVEEQESVALLIYIYWGAVIGSSKDMWWARLAGQIIVRRLSPLVSVEVEGKHTIIDWAKQRIGHG